MQGSVDRQCALSAAACVFMAGSVSGQQTQSSYDWGHHFTWNPPAGAVGMPIVYLGAFEHAWLKEYGGLWIGWGVSPSTQTAGFDPFGTDQPAGGGAVNVPSNGDPPVTAQYTSIAVPPLGYYSAGCGVFFVGPNTGSSVCAGHVFDIAPFGAGTPVTGELRAAGGVIANGPGTIGYAFSSPYISVNGTNAQGQVLWTPDLFIEYGWTQALSYTADPVLVTATAFDGTTVTAAALDIALSSTQLRRAKWQNGNVEIDARDATLLVSMDRRIVQNSGHIELEIRNNVVVASNSRGIFAGMAPAVGTVTPVAFTVPATIVIDYDASSLVSGLLLGVEVRMGGGADSSAEAVCPADFDGDGFVTGIDYDLYVAAFEEGSSAADFDGDGFITGIDFDLYVAAFEKGC